MDQQIFINGIKTEVVDGSIESMESNLIKPSGRKPAQKLTEMSEWFNQLKDDDKNMVLKIVKESVETTVFGFLCVLDGVRPLEDEETKGSFELYFKKHGVQQLINDPEKEYLHDLFN